MISEGARIVDDYGLAVGRDLGGVPPKTETKSRVALCDSCRILAIFNDV